MRLQPDVFTGYVNLFKSYLFERHMKKLCGPSHQRNLCFAVIANLHSLKLGYFSDGPPLLCKDESSPVLSQNSTAGASVGINGGHKGTLQHGS